ncbi:MAG: tetratricopeptide repeat protein [Granulosicoccaceae bacterium]|jgi:tetratricopeptide (TPR) repeat protein
MLRTHFTTLVFLSVLVFPGGCTGKQAGACEQAYTEAEQQYRQLRDLPADSEAFFSLLEQLENRLFKAFEKCPADARPIALMSEVQISAKQPSLALLYAQKALATDAGIWQSQHAMASALTLAQQYEEAVPYAEQASKLAPQRPGLQLGLCRAYALAGKHEQAVNSCSAVIESTHSDLHATAYYLRGLAYRGLGDTAQADQDQQQAQALGHPQK